MTCYVSRIRLLGLLLLALGMTGVCYFCTTLDGMTPRVIGWVGVVFFGLGSLVSVLPRLANRSPQITVDEQGITRHRWKIGVIPWSDIEQVWIGSVHSARFLCVRLKEPRMYLHQLSATDNLLAKANHDLGFGDLTFGFQGLRPGLDEVWAYILAKHTSKTPFATPNA